MNYQKHYDLLISRARSRSLNEYTETHHIIPTCLGGLDTKDNLVELTPEEHYLAHLLLVKIYPDHEGLTFAASMMGISRKNNKTYGWLRRKAAIAIKKRQSGKTHSQYGTMWITDGVNNRKIKKTDPIENGWTKGRTPSKKWLAKIRKSNKGSPGRKWTAEQLEKYRKTRLGKKHNKTEPQ